MCAHTLGLVFTLFTLCSKRFHTYFKLFPHNFGLQFGQINTSFLIHSVSIQYSDVSPNADTIFIMFPHWCHAVLPQFHHNDCSSDSTVWHCEALSSILHTVSSWRAARIFTIESKIRTKTTKGAKTVGSFENFPLCAHTLYTLFPTLYTLCLLSSLRFVKVTTLFSLFLVVFTISRYWIYIVCSLSWLLSHRFFTKFSLSCHLEVSHDFHTLFPLFPQCGHHCLHPEFELF